jgi:hypothetical protein
MRDEISKPVKLCQLAIEAVQAAGKTREAKKLARELADTTQGAVQAHRSRASPNSARGALSGPARCKVTPRGRLSINDSSLS